MSSSTLENRLYAFDCASQAALAVVRLENVQQRTLALDLGFILVVGTARSTVNHSAATSQEMTGYCSGA